MATISNRPFAVVTGASSGIGYELAKQFVRNGFDLLIVSGSQNIADAAVQLRPFGGNVQSTPDRLG